jgi:hypothetical protein
MKIALLIKIAGLSNNVYTNYILKNPDQFSAETQNLSESIKEIDRIMSSAIAPNYDLVDLKQGFKGAKDEYNSSLGSDMIADKEKTVELIETINQHADFLKKKGSPNECNHADLLLDINKVLHDRLGRINDKLGLLGVYETFPNPLYIPHDLGSSEKVSPIADEYRKVIGRFISHTEQKLLKAEKLKKDLAGVITSARQESVFFQTFVSCSLDISVEEKREIAARCDQIAGSFLNSAQLLESHLDSMLTLAGTLDFTKSDSIIESSEKASKVFQINRQLEQLISAADNLDLNSFNLDKRLYGLISHLDLERYESLKPYEVLEKCSLSRDEKVKEFLQDLASFKDLFSDDATLFYELKKIGKSIIYAGYEFYKTKTSELSGILKGYPSTTDGFYNDYLTGVQEQLSNRLTVLEKQVRAADKFDFDMPPPDKCPECWPSTMIWAEMAETGSAYSDSLKQMDALSEIESFYTLEKIQAGNFYSDSKNLFELNERLGNEPYLKVNPDGIDMVFKAGSRLAVIKGIGNAGELNLSELIPYHDNILSQSYIGLSPFSSIAEKGVEWIKPVGTALYNTASDVVADTVEIGGKISTTAGQLAQKTFDGVKTAARSVKQAGSKVLDVSMDWGEQFTKNLLYNDDGNISWWKVGGLALGGAACALTAGTACVALAISVGGEIVKGAIDTAAMDKYGLLSEKQAEWAKFGVDVTTIVAGGYDNYKHAAGKAWSHMGKIRKVAAVLGYDPKQIAGLGKVKWGSVKNWAKMAGNLISVANNTVSNIDNLVKLGAMADKIGSEFVTPGQLLYDAYRHDDTLLEYGNWYGPGYWGGSRDPNKPGSKPPVDSLDAIAMRHDFAYQIAKEIGGSEKYRIMAMADAIAVQEALALDPDPTKWDMPPTDPEKARRYLGRFPYGIGAKGFYDATVHLALERDNWITSPGLSLAMILNGNRLWPEDLKKQVAERVIAWYKNNPQPGVVLPGGAVSGQGQSDVSIHSGVSGQGQPGVPLVTPGSSGTQTDKYGGGKTSKDWENVQDGWDEVQPGWDKVYEGWDKVY